MSSSRLPGKVMLPLAGNPLILRMYERVAFSKYAGKIVIAVTTDESDNELALLCQKNHIARQYPVGKSLMYRLW